jgi:CBS domain-containing protein
VVYRVKDVMTDEVESCRMDDCLEKAAGIMKERGCGCVPVTDEAGHVVGLLTDRDALMCALRLGRGLADLPVSEACSRTVICCQAEDTLERAEMLMRVNHVRRLPVVEPGRVLSGVVSLTDLARHIELSAVDGGSGLSPRHIALVLAETSGVRRSPAPEENGPHTNVEPFFHG